MTARPSAGAGAARSDPRRRGPAGGVLHLRRRRQRPQRGVARGAQGPAGGSGRRVRLRQERHHARHHGILPPHRPRARPHAVRGSRSLDAAARAASGAQGQRHVDGLPGPDDVAQPRVPHRRAAHRHRALGDGGTVCAAPPGTARPDPRGPDQVRLPDPERILDTYPVQLSGGMRHGCSSPWRCYRPRFLIADEPGTALDVTTQDRSSDSSASWCVRNGWRCS